MNSSLVTIKADLSGAGMFLWAGQEVAEQNEAVNE